MSDAFVDDRPVRVRIAPSPTGYFHVGNARTAVFNWLFARHNGGKFIWRVEDTDRTRFVEGALEDQAESLAWLGIQVDEGPLNGGPYGPYHQSERLDIYRPYAEELLAKGHAYRCFCTPERLTLVREARQKSGQKVGYDRHCRNLSEAEVQARLAGGETSVLRLKMPLTGSIVLKDVIRGDIEFSAREFEDVVLIKTDGFPTYHFAVVVDDHLMQISHVLRADEWIPSSPIQIHLYDCFGWREPIWVHVPMVLNPGGKGKLSKRKTVDASGNPLEQMVQVREYRAAGYLSEAMFNYLSLLGWAYSADEDIFSADAAAERFALEDIKPSPAAWNPEKLVWMNGHYIRNLGIEDLAARLMPFLRAAGVPAEPDQVERLAPIVQERINTLADAVPLLDFFWADSVTPDKAELVPKKLDAGGTAKLLGEAALRLSASNVPWDNEALEAAMRSMAEDLGLNTSSAFQPLRVAVTGKRISPPLFETMAYLGRETVLGRLKAAKALLEA
jgi:glutamyl-tRNA synthetase